MKVKQFLTEENWGQHGKRFCLMDAVDECYGDAYCTIREKIVGALFSDGHGSPVVWNDAPERNYEEVHCAVRKIGYMSANLSLLWSDRASMEGLPRICQCCHDRPPVRYQSMCGECLESLAQMDPDDFCDKESGDLDFRSNTQSKE